ncbi:hypothetical protein DPX16_23674 [Anabarilius grahami]|uniref:ribonuclease H n=1 Tax=Anabarilius grahami TaxID=495550 RepID=A0A3N0Y0C0_ANAGA|nr:hypothetical protein DPX16_23674 [Anabarilius grahami]
MGLELSAPSVIKPKRLQNDSKVPKRGSETESSQNAMVWLRAGNAISMKPLKMSDMESICKSLPSPQNPGKFVTVLQTHTKYAHFTGADYRAVLLRTLQEDVTEVLLMDECPTLKRDNDKPTGSGTAASPHVYYWEEPENHDTFFKELRVFLDKRIGARQDLSFAANTKQKPKESASDFYMRFKKAWVEESKLPINTEMKALFTNTFLNNMQSKQAQLIRITTTNLFNMEIDALGQRIRELDSSGGFTVKTETAMFTEQKPQVRVHDQKVEVRQPSAQQRNSVIVCYYCGQEGHVRRDFCVLQYADDILVSGETKEDCEKASIIVCNVLAQAGFKASRDKLQWVKSKVTYLGHIIMPGQLTKAVQLHSEVAIVKVKGHAVGDDEQVVGNRNADEAAKEAAKAQIKSTFVVGNQSQVTMATHITNIPDIDIKILQSQPTQADLEHWGKHGCAPDKDGILRDEKGRIALPKLGLIILIRHYHEKPTHPFVPGESVLIKSLKPTKVGEPRYLGPATVIAVTRTGVLTDYQPQWIHASRIKQCPPGEQASSNSE